MEDAKKNEIAKIQLDTNISASFRYLKPGDEVEQRLTINSKGGVWFASYTYNNGQRYRPFRSCRQKITAQEAREILPLLETYAQYGDTIFEAYEGTWKMTIVYKDGTQKHYLGPARENAAVGDILLSEFIRRRIPIGGLYLLG